MRGLRDSSHATLTDARRRPIVSVAAPFVSIRPSALRGAVLILIGLLAIPAPAFATWSILIANWRTKEVAVGSATCLTNFDLQQNLPVLIVDVGAACAQSLVDVNAVNRLIIWQELQNGTSPEDIIDVLAALGNQHQSRQYGILDTRYRTVTFTGTNAGEWRGGVVGFDGDIYYAVQGNVLTGEPVITAAEQAILDTHGDLPDKLMAAMEAARAFGGDGRCSCSAIAPTSCGSPPPDFEKSAHIGFMLVSRTGDVDGTCTAALGCANGDYFMEFNVPFQTPSDPDPVLRLNDMFNAWRAVHVDRPDAVHSVVQVEPVAVPSAGAQMAMITIHLRDWQDTMPPDAATLPVSVVHAPDSAGVSVIGAVTSVGDGSHTVELTTPGGAWGRDRFQVVVDDGVRPVTLIPLPGLIVAAPSDYDSDGDVDAADYLAVVACIAGPGHPLSPTCPPGDLDGDLDIDLVDVAGFFNQFTAPPCRYLHIDQQPVASFHSCGTPFSVSVGAVGDPEPQYQWYLNGEPIAGATSATYSVDTAGNADRGYYKCRVANPCETRFTDEVLVRVFPNPCP